MSDLPNGTSARVHAEYALAEIEQGVTMAAAYIRRVSKMTGSQRAAVSRELAGVIGHAEGLRLWLQNGAPE